MDYTNTNTNTNIHPITILQNVKKYFIDNYNKTENIYHEIEMNETFIEKLSHILKISTSYYCAICDNLTNQSINE